MGAETREGQIIDFEGQYTSISHEVLNVTYMYVDHDTNSVVWYASFLVVLLPGKASSSCLSALVRGRDQPPATMSGMDPSDPDFRYLGVDKKKVNKNMLGLLWILKHTKRLIAGNKGFNLTLYHGCYIFIVPK